MGTRSLSAESRILSHPFECGRALATTYIVSTRVEGNCFSLMSEKQGLMILGMTASGALKDVISTLLLESFGFVLSRGLHSLVDTHQIHIRQ